MVKSIATSTAQIYRRANLPRLKVIKLKFILNLKIKHNEWLLADTCVRKQPIIAVYFKFESVLKFNNILACIQLSFID